MPTSDERRDAACAMVILGNAAYAGVLAEPWLAVAPAFYRLTAKWPDLFTGDFAGNDPPSVKALSEAHAGSPAVACPGACDAKVALQLDAKYRARLDQFGGAGHFATLLGRRDPSDPSSGNCGGLTADEVDGLTTQAALASSSQATLGSATAASKLNGAEVIATAGVIENLLVAAANASALKRAAGDIAACQASRKSCAAPTYHWNHVGSNVCAGGCTPQQSTAGSCEPTVGGRSVKQCDATTLGRHIGVDAGTVPTNPTGPSAFGWLYFYWEAVASGDPILHQLDPAITPSVDLADARQACDPSSPTRPLPSDVWQCVFE